MPILRGWALFSIKRLLWQVGVGISLFASFSVSKYMGWRFEIAFGLFVIGSIVSYWIVYETGRRRRWVRRQPRWARRSGQQSSLRAKRMFPQWQVYGAALLLFAGIVAIGVFWPKNVGTTSTAQQLAETGAFSCTVSSVHDGDTLKCLDGTKVRLHAVAARELDETCTPGHPCPSASGASAKQVLSRLALGHTLTCEQTGTSYGRVNAICRTEQAVEINCAMIESGHAVIWPKFARQRSICTSKI